MGTNKQGGQTNCGLAIVQHVMSWEQVGVIVYDGSVSTAGENQEVWHHCGIVGVATVWRQTTCLWQHQKGVSASRRRCLNINLMLLDQILNSYVFCVNITPDNRMLVTDL